MSTMTCARWVRKAAAGCPACRCTGTDQSWASRALALGAAHDRHQLFDLSALIGLVAGDDRPFDAMGDVVAQDFLLHAPKRGAHRRNLRHDVDAVAVLVDHAGDAAHLALDPAQALGAGRLDVFAHARYIPPQGISCNPRGTAHGERLEPLCLLL